MDPDLLSSASTPTTAEEEEEPLALRVVNLADRLELLSLVDLCN